jgi:hypothetical protein
MPRSEPEPSRNPVTPPAAIVGEAGFSAGISSPRSRTAHSCRVRGIRIRRAKLARGSPSRRATLFKSLADRQFALERVRAQYTGQDIATMIAA